MEISCAFPTALDSPEHIVLAEELGYDRAWLYDTPQQSPDVWMTLALAAERTERIGLGPGVLVPSLRHPMVNAAATATLDALAPGPRRRRVRDGVHRPPGDGLPRDPVGVHGRLHPRLPRPAARRDDRVGGRADADAAPARPRRAAAGRGADHHRRARAEGRRRRARAGRRPLRHARAPRVRRASSRGSRTCSGARSSTTARTRTPTACARPAGRGGRSPTTGPTSSGSPLEDLPGRRGVEGGGRADRAGGAPPRRPRASTASASTRPTQAAWDAGGHQMLDEVTMSGTADAGPRAARRPRRARRDGDRLPAVRARHPARARGVHGHREVRRGGLRSEHDANR